MIDWTQSFMLLLGASLGAFIGFRINCWRFRTGAPGAARFAKDAAEPSRAAGVIALAAFAGCAIAFDAGSLLGRPKPETMVLKYIFALVMGTAHYLFLKRVARIEGEGS